MSTSTTTALPTGTWKLDANKTTVTVSVRKLGFMTVPGNLTVTSGSIEIDANNQVTAVSVVADAASYDSNNAKRDEHVASDDFLDSANHPTITFESGAVKAAGGGYATNGTVTIKGKKSPINVAVSGVSFDDASGSFTATATVDRKAIGIDKMPNFVIGKDLELTVKATATRQG